MSAAYPLDLKKHLESFRKLEPKIETGKVTRVIGSMVQGFIPGASLGGMCSVHINDWSEPILAEVVGFRDRTIFAMPLTDPNGIPMGSRITLLQKEVSIPLTLSLVGRVIDASGHPLDGKGEIIPTTERSIYGLPPNPLKRKSVTESLDLGVSAINGFLTFGIGQRLGVFAGSGVGKSVLMGMMAKNSNAEINVICLVGERGREVNEFIQHQLGAEGLARSVVVVVTSDQSPLLRRRGAFTAITIAEYFRDQGKKVLFMMDSVTRLAMAQREIGLAMGEPPTTKGYPPSVFSMLPRLLERAGNGEGELGGGITGLYTVLVEGDDMDDPIADSVRSILDGHLVLSRDLAARNHYPAIDVMSSVSRTMINTVSEEHLELARTIRSWMAIYKRNEDLITVGAYVKGANPFLDQAIGKIDAIEALLKQGHTKKVSMEETLDQMRTIVRS